MGDHITRESSALAARSVLRQFVGGTEDSTTTKVTNPSEDRSNEEKVVAERFSV